MKSVLEKSLRGVLRSAKKAMMANATLRNALSDVENSDEFTNIYEHEKMLADSVRTNAYFRAITKHIKEGDVVIDLGTGSGILAFFAVRNKPKAVYAIDHSDFIEIAEAIAIQNGIDNVTFTKANSRDFTPPEQADVIIHEQIGDDLFDENMIANLLDLKKRALKETGTILPGKFELFLEPVALKGEYQVPFIWEQELHGIDFSILKDNRLSDKYKPAKHAFRFIEPCFADYFLCEPQPLLSFDLNDDPADLDFTKPLGFKRKVERAGVMDGICLYFRVIFDDEISFDTSPLHHNTSWGNRLFRTERRQFNQGDEVSFAVTLHNILLSYTWEFAFQEE